jgi:outer membrane protein
VRGAVGAAAVLLVIAAGAPPRADAQQTLDLNEAIRTALIRNPGITRAEANAATAAADRWADWGALLPSVTTNASFNVNHSSTITFLEPDGSRTVLDDPLVSDTKGNGASLSLGLSLSAETFTNVNAGADRRAAAEYRLDAAQRLVVQQVKVAYFEALKAERLVEVARRQADARAEDYEVTQDRYRIAAASRSDLLGSEIDLRNAELAVLDAEDAFDSAVRALRVAQGVEDMTVTEVTLVEPAEAPIADALDTEALVDAAVRSNPDLRALAADEQAAAASVWSARASYFPILNASWSFGRSINLGSNESLFTFNPANSSRGLQIGVSLPIFNGFQRKQRNASASNQLSIARANLKDQRLALESDVRRLVADIRRGTRRVEVLEQNALLAEERLDLTREQYRIGSVQYINLQQAIESLDQAQRAVFEQRYELLKRWAELEQAVGDAPR